MATFFEFRSEPGAGRFAVLVSEDSDVEFVILDPATGLLLAHETAVHACLAPRGPAHALRVRYRLGIRDPLAQFRMLCEGIAEVGYDGGFCMHFCRPGAAL